MEQYGQTTCKNTVKNFNSLLLYIRDHAQRGLDELLEDYARFRVVNEGPHTADGALIVAGAWASGLNTGGG